MSAGDDSYALQASLDGLGLLRHIWHNDRAAAKLMLGQEAGQRLGLVSTLAAIIFSSVQASGQDPAAWITDQQERVLAMMAEGSSR